MIDIITSIIKRINVVFFLLIFGCQQPNQTQKIIMNNISIIPKPISEKIINGTFDLKSIKSITLKSGHIQERQAAILFQKYLSPISSIPIVKESNSLNQIIISIDNESEIESEGYNLSVGEGANIELIATSFSGLFYGFQTFRQLCPVELEKYIKPRISDIQKCVIMDAPNFQYRGMHLDVSRHFFDVSFIKTYIDMIALHKMNVFHWHLTDDNGWRIDIKKYPELSKKSAWSVDRTDEPWKKQSPILPGEKASYGGYYTQDEIKDVVKYALDRNIMVIPEIEMPGHTSEVFAAFPNLSCKGDTIPVNPGSYWPNEDIFCAGNDQVFEFIEDVLTEVIDLFPSPYIHIGGDEAEKTNWKKCPKCQKRIKIENLKNENELQSYFIKRVEKFILSKNKKLVGWDEILEGGLAKSATVMSWRGMAGGIEAATAGHDVIMCPTSHCYFDYYQASANNSPVAFGGLVTLKKVYSFNPIPLDLDIQNHKYIIGAQGNLWTEYVQTPDRAQYRVLPRMTALSEVLWSGPGKNTYDDFYLRLKNLKKRFDFLNWVSAPGSFSINIKGELNDSLKAIKVTLSSEKPGEKIRFTLDGTNPSNESQLYERPFLIKEPKKVIAAIFSDNVPVKEYSEQSIIFHKAMGKKIRYNSIFNDRYRGSGKLSLIDGYRGTTNFGDGYWQGWRSESLDVIIDLGKITEINKIICGFLESHSSWIFLPTKVELSFSDDSFSFSELITKEIQDGPENGKPNRIESVFKDINLNSRFIKVKAFSRKICPDWHDGSGGHVWLFADEIIIE